MRQDCTLWIGLLGTVLLTLGRTTSAAAQVIELQGGSSSLYEATGGSVTLHGASYEMTVGTGVVQGQFVGGGTVKKRVNPTLSLEAGREVIPFDLPTDVFDDFHVVYGLGASMEVKPKGSDVMVFGGTTSQVYESPFFYGMSSESPVGVVRLSHDLGDRVRVGAEAMVSNKSTALASLAWKPTKGLDLAMSGGLGGGQPYGAGSVNFTSRKLDVKAAYIQSGAGFRRLNDDTLQAPEPDRANVQVEWRPWRFVEFSGGHQQFAMPLLCAPVAYSTDVPSVPCQTKDSTVNDAAVNLTVDRTMVSAAAYETSYNGETNHSRVFSVRRGFGRMVDWMATYLDSRPEDGGRTTTLLSTVQEQVTPRLMLNETVNSSNGQKSAGMGGGLISNLATVSVDYETYYVASRPSQPFENALIVDMQVNLAGGVTGHGQTFVAPNGRLLYTADARDLAVHDRTPTVKQTTLGPMEMRGKVLDVKGQPVEGAALMINELPVYTDSEGRFEVRERHRETHPLKVLADQFLDGKAYRVVSAPSVIRSSSDDADGGVTIVVTPVGNE